MPLLTIDLVVGRTPEQVTELLDAVQDAVVTAFGVPERDRYQIVHEHPATHLVVQDTGLGLARTADVVVIRVTSKARTQDKKVALYRELAEQLERRCGVAPSDLVVSIVENSEADWSFGLGRAQFLTGEL